MSIKLVNKYPTPTRTYTLDGYTKSCVIKEERNGVNEVKLTYVRTGPSASRFKVGMCLQVPNDRQADTAISESQYYDIYEIKKDGNYITVYGKHVFYRLDGYIVMPYTQTGQVISGVRTYFLWDCVNAAFNRSSPNNTNVTGFTFGIWNGGANISRTDKPFGIDQPMSLKSLLFEIMEYFDAEIVMNNMHVGFAKNRGQNRGGLAKYGLNVISYQRTVNTDDSYNAVTAYIYKADTDESGAVTMTFYSKTVDKPNASQNAFPHRVTALVDVTSKVNIEDFNTAKTQTDTIANQIAQGLDDRGQVNTKVKLADVLSSTERSSSEFADVKEISLCDTLHVIYPIYGIDENLKVVKTEFDAKKGRYETIELGSILKDLSINLSNIEGYSYTVKYK